MKPKSLIILFSIIGLGWYLWPNDRAMVAILVTVYFFMAVTENDLSDARDRVRRLEERIDELEARTAPDYD